MQPFNTQPFHLGLTRYPLGPSLSPRIHAAALKSCGLDGDYALFTIHSDDKRGLKTLLDQVRSGGLQGLNVTIPHKQNVIPLLDELTDTAKDIGAVNTIFLRGGKLIGDNTDAPGFLKDLQAQNLKIRDRRSALVLGAGGSARAIVYALLRDGWNITLAARRLEQSRQLAASFPGRNFLITQFDALTLQTFQLSNMQLLVNTTPVGMFPNTDQSPLPEKMSLPVTTFIYDLVYNPRETKLLRDARAQGLNAAGGLGMLIEQAALAFEIWTGRTPPRDVLWNAAEN